MSAEPARQGSKAPNRAAPHPTLGGFYGDDAARQDWVDDLFDRTAPAYDRTCAVMSFGMGRLHRRRVLARFGVNAQSAVLDVATGTGQVAKEALALGVAPAALIGLDPSAGMLESHVCRGDIPLLQGVGERLPFDDASFDFVTMGYALRHVADLEAAFAEYRRVLRPGGRVILLEIVRPKTAFGRFVIRNYIRRVVPALLWPFGMRRRAFELMDYYWATIEACVPGEKILDALRSAGFTEVRRDVMAGSLCEYSGVRAAD